MAKKTDEGTQTPDPAKTASENASQDTGTKKKSEALDIDVQGLIDAAQNGGGSGMSSDDQDDENADDQKPNTNSFKDKIEDLRELGKVWKEVTPEVNAGDLIKEISDVTADNTILKNVLGAYEGISFDKVIGSPLQAIITAQADAAKSTLKYVQEVGLQQVNGKSQVAVVAFEFMKGGKIAKIQIPLLTLVPIPAIQITEAKYEFKIKIDSSSFASAKSNASSMNSWVVGNVLSERQLGFDSGSGQQPAQQKAQGGQQSAQGGQQGQQGVQGGKPEGQAGQQGAAQSGQQGQQGQGAKADGQGGQQGAQGGQAGQAGAQGADNSQSAMLSKMKSDSVINSSDGVKFNVGYSTKKDSTATRESKYSVESTMDIQITAGPDSIPAGITKLLDELNQAIEIIDPNGVLLVSNNFLTIKNGAAAITEASYRDGNGLFKPTAITCKPLEKDTPDSACSCEPSGDGAVITIKQPGAYIITAGTRKQVVYASN